jgi:hypothetical protein
MIYIQDGFEANDLTWQGLKSGRGEGGPYLATRVARSDGAGIVARRVGGIGVAIRIDGPRGG